MAQDGSAGSANRSGPAGDPQAGAGLDSSLGSQGIDLECEYESSSKNSFRGSRGIEPGLDGGKCILDDQQHSGAGVRA